MLPDAYGAFWERDVHKYCVTREPRIVDTCDNHTLWECDFLKAFTIGERGIADSLHTVRNRDFRKTLAAAERPITDLLDAVRNGDAGQAGATVERRLADARHTIRNGDGGKTLAAIERKTADARHTVRNGDAGQAGATVERQGANARDDLPIVDRRDFDIVVGAGSDVGNGAGPVTVGHERQAFRTLIADKVESGDSRGGRGAIEDNGAFHGENPFFPWRSSLGVMPYAFGVTISAGTGNGRITVALGPLSGGLCLPVQHGNLED